MLTIATSKFHHLRHPFACRLRAAGGRRLSRGSGGAARLCRALDVAALRERRRRPAAQARQSGSAPGRNTHRAASRERLTRTAAAVDNGSHRGPTVTWRTWFCGAKSLICGAAGRIRTHDPLVRRFRAAPHRASCSSASINACRVVQSSARAYLPKSYPASRRTDRPEPTQESSPGSEVGVGAALEEQARDHESRGTASALRLL